MHDCSSLLMSTNGILLYTDFWDRQAHQIDELQYVAYPKDKPWPQKQRPHEVLLKIDVRTCSKWELAEFFRRAGDLCVQIAMKNKQFSHTQFYANCAGEQAPIKWFWIKPDHLKYEIGHDTAFDTTYVNKEFSKENSISIELGTRQRNRWERSKYAKEKQARTAYRCIANMIQRKRRCLNLKNQVA